MTQQTPHSEFDVPRKPPHLQGTKCEPWIDRGVITVLDHILQPYMRGLEYGAGSSSRWLLARLGSLVSIETVESMQHT